MGRVGLNGFFLFATPSIQAAARAIPVERIGAMQSTDHRTGIRKMDRDATTEIVVGQSSTIVHSGR